MKLSFIALLLACCLQGAAQPSISFTAVEVDKFVAARGVAFPADYQAALADDLAREISIAFPTVIIVHQGEPAPYRHALLRISGVVTRFKPGSQIKRHVIGFGAGATVVETQVWFLDAASGEVLLNREVKGVTWTGIGGGDSQAAGESLAKKVAKLCSSAHVVASN